jgi:hypothetical protein
MSLVEEITKLTDEWYILISPSHHKDRDCHWYIETRWSYGFSPIYTIQHNGYILHDFEDIECSSYEEALTVLRNTLIEKINEEKKLQEERKEEDY